MVQLTEMPDIGFSFIFDPFDGHDLITHPAFVNSTLSSGCQPFKFTERFRRNLPFVYIKSFVIQVNQPNYISKWAHILNNNSLPLLALAVKFQKTGRKQPKMPSNHPLRESVKSRAAAVTTAKFCWPDGPAGEEQTCVCIGAGIVAFETPAEVW